MAATKICVHCHKRKAKRDCPGLRGSICAVCCGTEREVSIDCPLDCSYLRESRRYEAAKGPLGEMPFPDVEIGDNYLAEREHFIGRIAYHLLRYALENPRTTDNDLLGAMEKLVRTYQTLSSGIYYESLPEEPSQVGVFRDLKTFLDELREEEKKREVLGGIKEDDVIRSLVFLSRVAAMHSNQRARGKVFIDFLRQSYPEAAAVKQESGLIVPGR